MAVIDSNGFFNGDRLRRCSNAAQLHWPRLFLASDGFARLEINYARIIGRAYATFNPVPSETELQSFLQEYAKNHLLFLYEAAGQLWGQWDTRSELLPRYKTAQDRRSPIPPEPAFTEWKHAYRSENKAFPKSFGNISETFLHGGGGGVGVGKNICASPDGNARVGSLPDIDNPAFDTLAEASASVEQKPPSEESVWGPKERRRVFYDEFWPAWPRKVSKAPAEKAWCKCATSPELARTIVNAVRVQLPQLTADLKFCPYPATWLNREQWNDEISQPQAKPYDDYPELQS